MAWTSRLSLGLPGITATPLRPPLSNASRESSRSPPLADCVWHVKQFVARSGRTLFSKNCSCSGETAAAVVGDCAADELSAVVVVGGTSIGRPFGGASAGTTALRFELTDTDPADKPAIHWRTLAMSSSAILPRGGI